MLKKAISFVLVSKQLLNVPQRYASGLFSPAALLLTFLSIPTMFMRKAGEPISCLCLVLWCA